MDRRVLRTAFVAALFGAAASAIWFAFRESGGPSPADEAGASTATAEAPPLVGARNSEASLDSRGNASASPQGPLPAFGPDTLRVRGQLRWPEGVSSSGGVAWLRGRASKDEPWRELARGTFEATGDFLLTWTTVDRTTCAGGFQVCASPDGFDAVSTLVPLTPNGHDFEADVVVARHDAVRGRVVDPDGRPVAGLRIRFVPWNGPGAYVTLDSLDILGGSSDSTSTPYFVHALTDSDGRFSMDTELLEARRFSVLSSPGPMFNHRLGGFVSESPEWFLRDDEERRQFRLGVTGSGTSNDIRLVADPGTVLRANVVDSTTSKPIEKFDGHAHWSSHGRYFAFDGRDGEIKICWPRWWSGDESGTVDLSIEADGHFPVQVPVKYAPGERTATVEVRVDPIVAGDAAHALFEIADAAGNPFDGPWWARIVDPRDPAKTIRDLGVLERRDAGLYEVAMPPGRWTILVKPNDWLGFLRWTETVEFARGENKRVRCVMPPHGTLTIRWPGPSTGTGDSREPTLSVRSTDGSVGSGVGNLRGKTEFRTTTCLAGDWKIELWRPSGTLSKNVRVRANEETIADLAP